MASHFRELLFSCRPFSSTLHFMVRMMINTGMSPDCRILLLPSRDTASLARMGGSVQAPLWDVGLSSFTSWNIWAIDDLRYPQSHMSKVQQGLLGSLALPGQKQGLIYWTPRRDLSSLCSSTLTPAACWTWGPRALRGPELRGSDPDITPSLVTRGSHASI